MKDTGRSWIAGVAIALWIASVASVEAQKAIRIGASLSTTGTYAALGQNQLRGYQLCVKYTNDRGGLLGRKVELVVEDDRSEASTAVRLYERFITQDKVDAVIGPYSRQYPGAREFVEAHHREYPGAELSFRTAAGYAGCQVLTEAVKRAGSLDGDRIRDAILKLDLNTVFGAFKIDGDGFQIAHKMVTFQWQDGKKVIVWPEELAPGKPRFPMPPWSERR